MILRLYKKPFSAWNGKRARLMEFPSMVKNVRLAREFSSMLCFAVLCALLCAVLYAVLCAQSVILNGASLATLASPFGQEACFCFASAFCRVWGCLGSSWGSLGSFWELLRLSWELLGLSWELLGLSWELLGLSWGLLEPSCGLLGPLRSVLGASWRPLEA